MELGKDFVKTLLDLLVSLKMHTSVSSLKIQFHTYFSDTFAKTGSERLNNLPEATQPASTFLLLSCSEIRVLEAGNSSRPWRGRWRWSLVVLCAGVQEDHLSGHRVVSSSPRLPHGSLLPLCPLSE